jgi:Cdc6-like AAA superfamily ATPase
MSNLSLLKNYFIAATAESENNFLDDVFVTSNDFYNIIEPISGTMRILVGSKGSGKSALLERLLKRAQGDNVPIIRLTPANLDDLSFEESISPAKIISIVKDSVIKHMAIEYGKNMKGFLSEVDNALFREAEHNGQAQKTLIDSLKRILLPIGKGVTDIDFGSICGTSSNTASLQFSIERKLDKEQKAFYVLLDDIDQIASVERKDRNDIIWGVLLAMFSISQELNNVFPIVTVRKEIWRQLTVDNGNRDKYDQIRGMIYTLDPSKDDMKKIVEKRLNYCIEKNKIGTFTNNPYKFFFEGTDCKLPSSSERRTWSDYFVSASRKNPRDIIQLVNHLISNAIENGRNLIGDVDVEDTALGYSEERVEDLISQNKDFCSGIDNIIRYFSKERKFEYTADEIKNSLINALGSGNVVINKKTIHSNSIDDVFVLWDTLNNIGFLNAQTVDNRNTKQYSFLPYKKSFIKISCWNELQKLSWHIHPCYRSYLIDLNKQDSFRKKLHIPNDSNTVRKNKRKKR